jgi:hypothetical protein
MSENRIGLHVYTLRQFKSREKNKTPIKFSQHPRGGMLSSIVKKFITDFADPSEDGAALLRDWYFSPRNSQGFVHQGLIMYGSSGFAGDIVNKKTHEVRLKREVLDMDVIPLYYRFWIPDSGDFALAGFQTFGLRSCISKSFTRLQDTYRKNCEGYHIEPRAVVLTDIKRFADGEVKSISLKKHDMSSDAAENQGVRGGDFVDLDVLIKAKPRSSLGSLSSVMTRIRGHQDGEGLQIFDTSFDAASAMVNVGGKKRKVGLLGASKDAGKIDITEDVTIGLDGFPTFDSIESEVEKIFGDLILGSGKNA